MPSLQRLLDDRVAAALGAAFPDVPPAEAPAVLVPAADPRFGDYQANGAMGLAKRLKRRPRDVAQAILDHLDVADMCESPQVAGPGFLNFRLRPEWVARELGRANHVEAAEDDRLGVEPAARPETVVVDYSAPNLAKEMHVGHLRSTIIGDALVRMLEFAGHNVVRQNHVGDWGTQFGMLVARLRESADRATADLADLEAFYRQAKARFDADTAFAAAARQEVVRLQSGDPDTAALWRRFLDISVRHCKRVYERLGVRLTDADVRGESAYNAVLPRVIEALRDKGLLTESEGAQCVFLRSAIGDPQSAIPKPLFAAKDGSPLPLIVQKSDEGFLYATTDLAAIAFRTGCLPPIRNPQSAIRNENSPRASRILYVVDARQALHFQMVFECARQAGFAPPGVQLVHVAFGTMMGADGRPFRTREGGTVKLLDLLDEAERRALALVTEKNAADVEDGRAQPLGDGEKRAIARIVGIGAVKYADLAQNRTSDYVFSWDKMLSLDGNTAPYMQYAYARVRSIFRKGGHEAEDHRRDDAPIPLDHPAELALAKAVLRLSETLDRALADYRPNVLAAYLFDLAQAFTAFYDACPVLASPEPTRTARLQLCDLTARAIQRGLGLLGIETAERM